MVELKIFMHAHPKSCKASFLGLSQMIHGVGNTNERDGMGHSNKWSLSSEARKENTQIEEGRGSD